MNKIAKCIFFSLTLLALFTSYTLAYQPARIAAYKKADEVLIKKSARRLYLLRHGKIYASFPVTFGPKWQGAKHQRGDDRTPEGTYRINYHLYHSHFYRALHISYPNNSDRAWARHHHVSPGGAIMIHGEPTGHHFPAQEVLDRNWTAGCIATTDKNIRILYHLIKDGTEIKIES